MAGHYELIFVQEPVRTVNVLGMLPKWSSSTLGAAQSALQYDFADGSSLLRQILAIDHFYVELCQIRSKTPFLLRYRTTDRRLFLFFMLEGTIGFSTQDLKAITKAKKDNFYVSHNAPGLYNVDCEKGQNLALVVSIDPDWALAAVKDYPNLSLVLSGIIRSDLQFSVMPHCRINKRVKVWLEQLRGFASKSMGTLKSMLNLYTRLAFEFYEELLNKGNALDAYKTKEFTDLHFTDPSLDLSMIESHMKMGRRGLQAKFKKEFRITISDYIIKLRMEQAEQLLKESMVPLQDIWLYVGYRDPNTFDKAYRNFRKTKKNH